MNWLRYVVGRLFFVVLGSIARKEVPQYGMAAVYSIEFGADEGCKGVREVVAAQPKNLYCHPSSALLSHRLL
jgi:hypothetical protein